MQISSYASYTLLTLFCIMQNETQAADETQAAHILITDDKQNVLVAEEYAREGTVSFIGCSYTPPTNSRDALAEIVNSDYGIRIKNTANIKLITIQSSSNITVSSIQSNQGKFFYSTSVQNVAITGEIKNNAIKQVLWFPINAIVKNEIHNNLTSTKDHARIVQWLLPKA